VHAGDVSNAHAAATRTVNIYWNETHQTIDGFGAAQWWDLYNTYPEPQRSQIIDLAFSSSKGIGLSILRRQIEPHLEPSPGAWNYHYDPEHIWLIKEAQKRGPVKLVASVWSPPEWMKTNGRTNGGTCSDTGASCFLPEDCSPSAHCVSGSLRSDRFQAFADYLSHYANQYAHANGVSVYALSMANEPDTAAVYWDTCMWTSEQIADFLANYLRPTFAANQVTTKVISPEAADWDHAESKSPFPTLPGSPPLLTQIYNNAAALDRLDIAAAHMYGGHFWEPLQGALAHGKPVWQTEASLAGDPATMDGALSWASRIHQSLTGAQVSAWLWWTLALPPENGESLIPLHGAPRYSVTKTFWALGNFSKFIRPGFVRVSARSANSAWPDTLDVSAYKDLTTGKLVIVIINRDSSAFTLKFTTVGYVADSAEATPYVTSAILDLEPQPKVSLLDAVSVPARSIVTYVTQPTADLLWRHDDGHLAMWHMKGNGTVADFAHPQPIEPNWQFQGTGDFNGDGLSDIVWRDLVTGNIAIWLMNGASVRAFLNPSGATFDWAFRGVGDVDGDGISDLIWHHSHTGNVAIWLMSSDGTVRSFANPGTASNGWILQGVGDFNDDGRADLFWQNYTSLAIWMLDGETILGYVNPPQIGPEWVFHGIGRFNRDGTSDIVWRSSSTGNIAVWWMHEGLPQSFHHLTGPTPDWKFSGVADTSGDGLADLVWRHSTTGNVAIWLMDAEGAVGRYANPASAMFDWSLQGFGRFD
jgi:glucuronoarabinoxylan endo-1,4-beta-xylanase